MKSVLNGGSIEPGESYRVGGSDEGVRTKWLATSAHTGVTEWFWTRNAAEFWLWLIDQRVVSQQARAGVAPLARAA
jgi:hypothetical protein